MALPATLHQLLLRAHVLLTDESEPCELPALRDLQLDDGGGGISQALELPALATDLALNLLGEPLSAADSACVHASPVRTCLPGEIVAVASEAGVLRYARVLEEDGDVKVQISRACIRWYAAADIRVFASAVSGQDMDKLSQDAVSSATVGCYTSQTAVASINVVAQVNALLARLNVSLGSSHVELLTELQRLHQHAASSDERLRAALRRVEILSREKYEAQKALRCAVCMDHSVDRVLVPCGHIFCGVCVDRVTPNGCPVCRQPIESSVAFHVP